MTDPSSPENAVPENAGIPSAKTLSPVAQRALDEARARRAALDAAAADLTKAVEIDGRDGPEPVRYGDWENKGIASDF